jgi:hypothetical protein
MDGFVGGGGRRTRKGTRANHPGVKLITVTDGIQVKRIPKTIAIDLVATGNWKYCPKKFKIVS